MVFVIDESWHIPSLGGGPPLNVSLASLHVKKAEFAKPSGQARVTELFRSVRERPIQRPDIAVAARHEDGRQVDLRARVRDAKKKLVEEGLLVLRGWNKSEREEAARRSYVINSEQCICLSLVPAGTGA
jgi:Restriction endonuclease NaeI